MNTDHISFVLEHSEAAEMDELFLSNKSFKKQTEVLDYLEQLLKESTDNESKVKYYALTLVSELADKEDYTGIEKYLKYLSTSKNVLVFKTFLVAAYTVRHDILNYSNYTEAFKGLCVERGFVAEELLKGFI